MKEIDFLPQWYKTDRRRQVSYHRQYAAAIAVFAVLVCVSFLSGFSVSHAKAQLKNAQNRYESHLSMLNEYNQRTDRYKRLNYQAEILNSIDTGMKVSGVLAEISHLIHEEIIIKRIEIYAEQLQKNPAGRQGNSLSFRSLKVNHNHVLPEELVRFRVTIAGIARYPENVAKLISELENSDYFLQVIPNFSRDALIDKNPVTEFEITSYLATYREDDLK